MELEKYELKKMIGSGSYGEVYKAVELATNKEIALKLIKKKPNASEHERKEQKKFLKECNIHSSLSHPNIIRMLRSFETVEYIVVVTELAGIDLHQFMSRNKLLEKHVRQLTLDLLSALHYLHSGRFLHRDLKPQNILLNNFQNIDNMQAKLCDFGLARKMTSETYLLTSVKGTPIYMAPEVMDLALYDERADLWSLGCIIYEAHFRTPPIKTQTFSQLLKWLRNPEIVWPSSISEVAKSFIEGLLKKEPMMRLTWPQIVQHPYVKDNLLILDNHKIERPLTEDLTTSQQVRKEKQRDEIIFNRGKKMIAEAMNKCQQAKSKNHQKLPEIAVYGKRKQTNLIGDNESISSDDSVHAIIQTDLETDVEGPLIKTENKLPAESELPINPAENHNLVIQRYADNFAVIDEMVGNRDEKENTNLKIGTMFENFEEMKLEDENKWCAAKGRGRILHPNLSMDSDQKDVICKTASSRRQIITSTELLKRKQNHNLDNISVCLNNDPNSDKKCEKCDEKDKTMAQCALTENTNEHGNTDTRQDTYEDDQSPPIENEEWLAFIHMSMQEILNGETESLKHQNLVGIIVAILRNFNASTSVIGSVVQLLSIPFVLPIPSDDIEQIKTVYCQTKLLPNLIYASKLVCMVKNSNSSFSLTMSSSNFGVLDTTQEQIVFKNLSDLSANQLKILTSIYELVCYLIHSNENFLSQFCDSMYIIANDLLRHILKHVVYDIQTMKLVCAIVSMLCFVLRETPENAELVESVIFHDNVDIIILLQNGNDMLRSRMCNLLRIIARFSCSSLQKIWSKEFKQALESLLYESNTNVKEAAKNAIDELSHLSFYNL